MKKFLFFISISLLLLSCSKKPNENVYVNMYIIDLTLVNNEHKIDTLYLIKDTELKIDSYKGSYGLRITPKSLIEQYDYTVVGDNSGFLKFACIDFKIVDIIPHHVDIIEYDWLGFGKYKKQ